MASFCLGPSSLLGWLCLSVVVAVTVAVAVAVAVLSQDQMKTEIRARS